MKEVKSFLLFTILSSLILFTFTGCEDKKVQEPFIPIENTTEIFTQEDKDLHKAKQEREESFEEEQKIKKQKTIEDKLEIQKEIIPEKSPVSQPSENTFTLSDTPKKQYLFTVNDQKIDCPDINQSIVILNFFTTSDTPCCGELPYLSDLQEKYKTDIFVTGVLLDNEEENHMLKQFISKYPINYFISDSKQNAIFTNKVKEALQLPKELPTPLTVIYKDGKYYTHYEGAVPIEMIAHDIKQIIKD